MGLFKSYFVPGKADKNEGDNNKKAAEKSTSISLNDQAPQASSSVNGSLSRPPSFYPQGDFRNDSSSIADVKAEVMCNWLYQQQLERHYASGMLPGEGVVLKKSRSDFACCPANLKDIPYSLYDMVRDLNVRVCRQVYLHGVMCLLTRSSAQ
jgi:hypothetical protein